jgi:L-aspartate oxidase
MNHLEADVVVVGSGLAGLVAALELAPLRVHLVTRGRLAADGSTAWAQGGIAAAVGPGDSPAHHALDTVSAGAGWNDPAAVEVLTAAGPAAIERLGAWGVDFDRDGAGQLALGREAAHGRPRIVHARDRTGAEVARALSARVREADHVRVFELERALRLGRDGGVASAVHTLAASGVRTHAAPCVLLATGGCGQLFRHTTNPAEATGDGLALALAAGVHLRDLELVQFHPTALAAGDDPMPLLSEALRGHGALIVDRRGRRFLVDVHPDAELAPRDVVARAVARQSRLGDQAFLDLRPLAADLPTRFPAAAAACAAAGLDPARDLVPIAPAAHYHMGGIATDLAGRSSLPGLWACGEVAATGVHGANRLASNSLLEAVVFARRAAADIAARGGRGGDPGPAPVPSPASTPFELAAVERLRDLMWAEVGLLRHGDGLRAALREIDRLLRLLPPGPPRDRARVSRALAAAALEQVHSRGAHVRLDDVVPGSVACAS